MRRFSVGAEVRDSRFGVTTAILSLIDAFAAVDGDARVDRREMSQEMDQDEIAEAQKAARRWIDSGVVKLAA